MEDERSNMRKKKTSNRRYAKAKYANSRAETVHEEIQSGYIEKS